jgi:NAD(P)-dependent dehydrogenase (short-subunit alcohol dehydrogenase family)
MMEPKNTAVISGGAGALGQVLVREFVQKGYRVAVPTRQGGTTEQVESDSIASEGVLTVGADLTREADVRYFVDRVSGMFGGIGVLVNAAGAYAGGSLVEETSVEEWDRMMSTNLKSAFLLSRGILPGMRAHRFGRIITIAAMSALIPASRRSAYAVSKRGVVTLTEVLAEETRGAGITVNAIAPGTIRTDANLRSMPGADTGAWVSPEEIARLALFLCSDDGRSISGNVIRVFGGA